MCNHFFDCKVATVLATVFMLCAAVSCDPVENEGEEKIRLEDLIGAWEADGYRWDLDEGASRCYQMDDEGQDFAYDEQGNLIYLSSIREYCEQYAADYNADPNNTVKGTAEDFANHDYSGTYLFTNINVTETEVIVWMGQSIPNAGTFAAKAVSGEYVYDEETATFTVDDLAIPDDPRSLKINVFKDSEGRMNFRWSDYDMYTTPTYDGKKTYYVYAPMIFYCRPGEAYEPNSAE